ncbi:conserved hypothetical protein [Francisella tularensis subsp. novicida FTE]|nr:conserved hypothetical protein [Francisella tularensis subsp. novicida FTE]
MPVSLYTANFLIKLANLLENRNSCQEVNQLKQVIKKQQENINKIKQQQELQIQKVKSLNEQSDPKKVLLKIKSIKQQLEQAKIGFLTKKRLNKLISEKEDKYFSYVKFVEESQLTSTEISKLNSDSISLERVFEIKGDIKFIAYYQHLVGSLASSYSIMPELLNAKYLLQGGRNE